MTHTHTAAELELARLALALGAETSGGPLSNAEQSLANRARDRAPMPSKAAILVSRKAIQVGNDPLGDRVCEIRPQVERRALGAFYTDPSIVESMLRWIDAQAPSEIIDCGSGTGRFAIAAARIHRDMPVLAVEIDPLACLISRATAAVLGLSSIVVLNHDFTTLKLPVTERRRAFIGNPPYVRHHTLTADQKARARKLATSLGIAFSGLSGLHAHFIVAAAALAKPADVLCFITSAEWLDVNYGRGVRELMMDGLRAEELHLLDASAEAFGDVATTAVIICARAGGNTEQVRLRSASSLGSLLSLSVGGRMVARAELQMARAWGKIARNRYADAEAAGNIPLGSIARVHRGAVTGANEFFVMSREKAESLGLRNCVRPVLTAAEEVFASRGTVHDRPDRKVILCPPERLSIEDRAALDRYIARGEAKEIHERYVPAHRSPWWRPQLLAPPPIVSTYMARQAPFFALNPDGLHILNVIHGLYPRTPLDEEKLRLLVQTLNEMRESYRGLGRTYQGGLEKFEPREMERLTITLQASSRLAMLCDG
jgi:predicted RNA methylase